jgi:hypothetical protein
LLFRQGEELLDIRGRHVRVHHQCLHRRQDHGDRREVLHRIEGRVRIRERGDGQRRIDGEQQRVAVGRRLGHRRVADDAARARTILDDERLLQVFAEALAEQPRDHVGRSTGGIGHDHAHRLYRVGLGAQGS